MSRDLKEHEFKEKSLKLLADPWKLKDIHYNPKNNDSFKNELEYKFNCELSELLYKHITQEIENLIIIDSVLLTIINQVNSNHNP
jgi:hypothetical protein